MVRDPEKVLRGYLSSQHDGLVSVPPMALLRAVLEIEALREALMRVRNFPSLPGGRADEHVDERDDPATNWRHGWICAVEEIQQVALPNRRKRL